MASYWEDPTFGQRAILLFSVPHAELLVTHCSPLMMSASPTWLLILFNEIIRDVGLTRHEALLFRLGALLATTFEGLIVAPFSKPDNKSMSVWLCTET